MKIQQNNHILADKIRHALVDSGHVEEKKMFGSLAFMVNGKMCLSAGKNRMMVRIDLELHEEAVKRDGCRVVTMRGRNYRGYIYVNEENLRKKSDFDYWIRLALDFNAKLISGFSGHS